MKAHSAIYNTTINDALKELNQFPWENKAAYAMWLSQTWYFVKQSTRLLALAAAHCELSEVDLHRRFLSHLKEETGHEILAEQDLKYLGYKPTEMVELNVTKAFYQTQYYYLYQFGSYHLMGWICFLEGIASRFAGVATKRASIHGAQAVRFLKLHGEEDVEHINSAFKVIDQFNPQQSEYILNSFLESAERYHSMLVMASQMSAFKKAV